jgi:hypothetical protein
VKGHIHTDALHGIVFATYAAVWFHVFRIIGAYTATHASPQIGNAIGGFFTFG